MSKGRSFHRETTLLIIPTQMIGYTYPVSISWNTFPVQLTWGKSEERARRELLQIC
jgi:hypothetical protein